MTDDLDTLRPEIREAVAAIDKGNGVFVNGDDCDGGIAWATARAELLRLQSTESRANEWQLLAERAEAELAALKSQPSHGHAQDAINKFGVGGELSHEEMCEVVNQAVCAERELAALKDENAQLRDVLADRDMDREMAAHANKELAALKARIANSRTTDVFESEGHAGMVAMGGLPCEWIGKNVRLVVED